MSTQVSYNNADTASELVDAVLSNFPRLSAIPSFMAYAAHCDAAIPIPFMWTTERALKERSYKNVKANVKIALFVKRAMYAIFYHIHARNPIILENEPKFIDPKKLTSFRTAAVHARESILGTNRIL
ncbi:hypothetical protein AYL99_00616 [Fonsecaea erecta]|uniref:Uncharacterized protein n=1 Tax=Fonsecaea erecta TaxID=1367422 RepID=A0A178ZXW2_9EURO|nr:hypothetical protein AYL99_00616 [Fonsecaea erecta]OAP64644.1 hypothetical protein AYL99_00616 [Fonsecaea erecta]